MDFNFDFEKIKKGVKKTALKVKEVSGNAVETAKFKIKLAEINSNIENKYAEIGKVVYESDGSSEVAIKVQELCDEITALKTSADDMKEAISDLTNKKACPYCSASVDKNYTFCPECGKAFDEE